MTTDPTSAKTYEVTTRRRRWQVTLAPDDSVLKVKHEQRGANGGRFWCTSWQRSPGGWSSPQGHSSEAVEKAIEMQRREAP